MYRGTNVDYTKDSPNIGIGILLGPCANGAESSGTLPWRSWAKWKALSSKPYKAREIAQER